MLPAKSQKGMFKNLGSFFKKKEPVSQEEKDRLHAEGQAKREASEEAKVVANARFDALLRSWLCHWTEPLQGNGRMSLRDRWRLSLMRMARKIVSGDMPPLKLIPVTDPPDFTKASALEADKDFVEKFRVLREHKALEDSAVATAPSTGTPTLYLSTQACSNCCLWQN